MNKRIIGVMRFLVVLCIYVTLLVVLRPVLPIISVTIFRADTEKLKRRTPTNASAQCDREIGCRHSVFMFTSNLDAKEILDELETRKARLAAERSKT